MLCAVADPVVLRCGHAYCRACAATWRLRSEPSAPRAPQAERRCGKEKMKKHRRAPLDGLDVLRTAVLVPFARIHWDRSAAEEAAEERRREIEAQR